MGSPNVSAGEIFLNVGARLQCDMVLSGLYAVQSPVIPEQVPEHSPIKKLLQLVGVTTMSPPPQVGGVGYPDHPPDLGRQRVVVRRKMNPGMK